MAIQMRRGDYNKFAPSKLLPAEWAIVQQNDPNSADGESVYIAFTSGNVKRMAMYEDMVQNVINAVEEGQADIIKALTDACNAATSAANSATSAAKSATSAADTAATKANNAASSATSAASSATSAASSANSAATKANTATTNADTATKAANSAADAANDAAEKALGSITQDGFYFKWQQEGSDYRLVLITPDPA